MKDLFSCKTLCNTHTHTRNIVLPLLLFLMIITNCNIIFSQNCNSLPIYTAGNTFNNVTITQALNLTGQNIRISGTVNFNANVTFTQCNVLMDPNAVINVNNSTFQLLPGATGGSLIFACTTMWNAIIANAKWF